MSNNYSRLNISQKIMSALFLFCAFAVSSMAASVQSFEQKGGPGDVLQQAECKPVFAIEHLTLNCLEALVVDELPFPNVYSQCGRIIELNYEDEYVDLGCHVNGLTGWFQKDNWIQSKIKGDGGVDVTGAPNALLVEGANKALVEVVPGSITSLTVVVPADGFITFDWSIVGGSNLSLTVRAGESTVVPDRYFVSQSLKAGDSFSLLFQSTFEDQPGQIELANFQFLTNINTLIHRTWMARDEAGRQSKAAQFIGVEGIKADQILMPLDINTSKSVYKEDIPLPEKTGYPIFDRDGDWVTSDDQLSLQGKSCSVKMSWSDQTETQEDKILISRKWVIEQGCGRNTIIHTQNITLHHKYADRLQPRKGIGASEKKGEWKENLSNKKKNYYSFIPEDDSN
jgi:hypothetical protein